MPHTLYAEILYRQALVLECRLSDLFDASYAWRRAEDPRISGRAIARMERLGPLVARAEQRSERRASAVKRAA